MIMLRRTETLWSDTIGVFMYGFHHNSTDAQKSIAKSLSNV